MNQTLIDNDGTLWTEQPSYTQFAFAMDRVKAVSSQHPEWNTQEPFKSALAGDLKGVIASGVHGLVELPAAACAGMATDEYDRTARDWLATARHQRVIGRRPILAFGNSDGDLPMLEWTAAGGGRRFCGYVHHTDNEREYAYDRTASTGRLDKGLDEAAARGWTVVDMKQDWKRVFPFESATPGP